MVETQAHAVSPSARRAGHAHVHLRTARAHRALCLQQERHASLADRAVQHEVVLGRLSRRCRPRGAEELDPRGSRRDGCRARARHARLARRCPLPLLRARGDHLRRHPADRASRHRHRAGAAGDDHRRPRPHGCALRAHDDRHRPRDLLHRRRLQQRHRAAPSTAGSSTRRLPISAPTPGRPSATCCCRS